MSSNNIAISVKNLSKCYAIYDNPSDRLKQFVMPRIRKLFSRPHKPYYREFWALKDVSFEVKKGETVGIIGRNGSGKSTLLQMICGTLTPTSGSIQTNGRIAALLELGSGFNPEFTGRENVYMNATVLGLTKDEIDARFADIVAFADIGDFIEQPVKTYSSGMFVRLAFAIQANVDPEILIVDEALAVGDVFFVHKCMARFHELKSKGTTIILVSHDTTAIKTLCDRAIWLKVGRMEKLGYVSSVVDDYLKDDFKYYTNENTIASIEAPNEFQEIFDANSLSPTNRQCNGALIVQAATINDLESNLINQIFPNKPIILAIKLKNNSLTPGSKLVLGYRLTNVRGIDIASNSNEVENNEVLAPIKGGTLSVGIQFSLPYLHPGQYAFSISVGLRDKYGEMQALDLLDNVLRFEMLEEKKCHVFMTFDTTYTVTYEQDVL